MNKPKTPENDKYWCTGNDMCPICSSPQQISTDPSSATAYVPKQKPSENVIYLCRKCQKPTDLHLRKFENKCEGFPYSTPFNNSVEPYIPQANYLELKKKLKIAQEALNLSLKHISCYDVEGVDNLSVVNNVTYIIKEALSKLQTKEGEK